MIDFPVEPGGKVIDLGCAGRRHPKATVGVDVRKDDTTPEVDFKVNFENEEWVELASDEMDVAYCGFVLEHVTYRKVPYFLKNTLRILKPGGRAYFIVPNTEAQLKWVLERGWEKLPPHDRKESIFHEASCKLYGDSNYPENTHKAFFSPALIAELFQGAGFEDVVVEPLPSCATDMVVRAKKPLPEPPVEAPVEASAAEPEPEVFPIGPLDESRLGPPILLRNLEEAPKVEEKPLHEKYGREYWDRYQGGGFIWDWPSNEVVARKLLEQKPASVIELGCGRAYVLKRLQDAGVPILGLDCSRSAWATRACDPVNVHDLTKTPWPVGDKEFDLAFSNEFWEHVPEDRLEAALAELTRVSRRGLHGITFEGGAERPDPNRQPLKSKAWWEKVMPRGHEVVDARELVAGETPKDWLAGDGRLKLNLGSSFQLVPFNWHNLDIVDAEGFARAFRYHYVRHDLREGLPYSTGVVDLILLHHVLEHFSYDEGLRLLRECRRVIRPSGALRIVVPDTEALAGAYINEAWHEGHSGLRLADCGEFNEAAAKAKTNAPRLWAILGEGHKSFYDKETLEAVLEESGWTAHPASFRATGVEAVRQIMAEASEMDYGGCSLFTDATPALG